MKHFFSFIACLLCATAAFAEDEEAAFLKTFEYDQRVYDFGTIEEKDGKVSHTFTFINKGKETVLISDVNAWCGCTTAQFTKTPVQPGKTAQVTITYDPNLRPGKFSKEAVLNLNGGKYYTRIWVKGNVVGMVHPVTEDHPYSYGEGLYMSQSVIPFSVIPVGSEDSIRVLIANDTDREMTVDFQRHPNNRLLQMPRRMVLKAGERTKFYAKYKARKAYGCRRYITIQPLVNGKKVKPLKVTWLANEK